MAFFRVQALLILQRCTFSADLELITPPPWAEQDRLLQTQLVDTSGEVPRS